MAKCFTGLVTLTNSVICQLSYNCICSCCHWWSQGKISFPSITSFQSPSLHIATHQQHVREELGTALQQPPAEKLVLVESNFLYVQLSVTGLWPSKVTDVMESDSKYTFYFWRKQSCPRVLSALMLSTLFHKAGESKDREKPKSVYSTLFKKTFLKVWSSHWLIKSGSDVGIQCCTSWLFPYTVIMMQIDFLEDLQVHPSWFAFQTRFSPSARHSQRMIPKYNLQLDCFEKEKSKPTHKSYSRNLFGRKKSKILLTVLKNC